MNELLFAVVVNGRQGCSKRGKNDQHPSDPYFEKFRPVSDLAGVQIFFPV